MKKNLNFDPAYLKEFYLKNKEIVISVVGLFVSLILFFMFVIPLGKEVIESKNQRDQALKDLSVMEDNYNYISGLNDGIITDYAQTLTKALPVEKDFGGILSVISSASIKSGAAVGNFEFQVGDIEKAPTGVSGNPSMQLLITVESDLRGAASFADALSESLPLSEVTSIDFNNGNALVSVLFYYKPINRAAISSAAPLRRLTARDEELIAELREWKDNVFAPFIPSTENLATSSGSPF